MWAHCGRGSLEDVLRADDIPLDWTFRLSLLTDLVKGMRHLHASPLRLHGRLSSRACLVDSRWVLRVSDYGLPALGRAQPGVAPPPHSPAGAHPSLPPPPAPHPPPPGRTDGAARLQSCCGRRRSCCARRRRARAARRRATCSRSRS